MEFTLKLIPELPTQLVLTPEIPLCGVKFLEEAGKCLKRNLDLGVRNRHQTIGPLSAYDISVPQAIAIESKFFEEHSSRYLIVDDGFLNNFIFHAASFNFGKGNRCWYPYYQDEIVLISYIDELAVVDLWRTRGFPETLKFNNSGEVTPPDETPDEGSGDLTPANYML